MEKDDISKPNQDKKEEIINKGNLIDIRSKYIIKKIFDYFAINKTFKIIKYNKEIQSLLDISKNSYKEYSELEIQIKLAKKIIGKFINLPEKIENNFKIYFDNSKKEVIKKYEINNKDKIKKIKITSTYKYKKIKQMPLFKDCNCIEEISIRCYRSIFNNLISFFWGCSSLKKIEFIHFNTEHINDIGCMFANCKSLEEIIFNDFNTEKMTIMNDLFCGCESLKKINLSNFNTKNVTDMSNMFGGCKSLQELNLSNFDTENVDCMCHMFNNCYSLKKLNLSNFNTNKVTNMGYMFYDCRKLSELDISNFNTENVKYMYYMFSNCESLKNINISKKFKIFDDTDIRGKFDGCSIQVKNKIKEINNDIDFHIF